MLTCKYTLRLLDQIKALPKSMRKKKRRKVTHVRTYTIFNIKNVHGTITFVKPFSNNKFPAFATVFPSLTWQIAQHSYFKKKRKKKTQKNDKMDSSIPILDYIIHYMQFSIPVAIIL